jgi:hypothetical protein
MIERKNVPVDGDFTIAVVTEQMNDGGWAVVASVKHHSPTGEQITDLPVQHGRYATQAKAEEAGVRQGRDWIARNAPRAA